jgi:hypothetical protein
MRTKIPERVLNPILYRRAYDKVTRIYGTQTSAYRSMAIVKEYKSLGGKYAGQRKRSSIAPGVRRWLRERWIMVTNYVLEGKTVPCGNHARRQHACRPLVRVTKKTPMTVNEVLSRHGPEKTLRLARTKRSHGSERTRIDWKKGAINLRI